MPTQSTEPDVSADTKLIIETLATLRKHKVQHQRTRIFVTATIVVGTFLGLHHVHVELLEEMGNLPLHAFLGVAIDKILFGFE